MKLRRLFSLGGAFLIILLKFAVDVIAKNVDFDWGGLAVLRELALALAFTLLYFLLLPVFGKPEQSPVRKLGFLLILTTVMLLLGIGATSIPLGGFDTKALSLIPLDYATLFIGSFTSLLIGVYALVLFGDLVTLLGYGRRKGTHRNAIILIGLIMATAVSAIPLRPLDTSVVTTVIFGLAILMAVVNSFRLPWIIDLSKREKVFGLVYSFFLFLLLTGLTVLISQSLNVSRSLLFYSVPLKYFVQLTTIFGTIYAGMAFVSTLFHLPTSEAFERKRTEVTSLHNLSRLVTQVFDFNELVDTVTTMTLDVCEAKSCWLEIVGPPPEGTRLEGREEQAGCVVQVAAIKNITQEEIDRLVPSHERSIRDDVLESQKPMVIDDLRSDARFRNLPKPGRGKGSMVVVPLLSHGTPLGLLYATKDVEYGFIRDDVDVISAFADQATVAIDNSRLIKKSIERERLLREMMLAQEMQKKLLPQSVPIDPSVDVAASSTPAFEVGGDYYDFVQLDNDRIGFVVGDVSGKGVSAAFYMAEVKGIFLALAHLFSSPREFLTKANEALAGSIDKHCFVSLIYAILDLRTGRLTIARAGHCPMLLLAGDGFRYIRPDGLGLGLTEGRLFRDVLQEHAIQLADGDLCVLYTDGVTEARSDGEEYGYERLVDVAQRKKHLPAVAIKDEILKDVRAFVGGEGAHHDDLTLVVVKWHNSPRRDIDE
jgi:serine phosphatase RsbU (regulator of sigma subunit)